MQSEALQIRDFLALSQERLIIDVRAPIEFSRGHIPGAINMPLFDDMERAEIGTLYKQNGKEDAVLRGFELVAPKLAEFIREAKSNSAHKDIFVYCFRGGMRSNSFAWLMNTAGLRARILKGGYKSFRHFVLKSFETPRKLILLGGATGSGKTEILQKLSGKVQLVDLEGIAHHKGSAFGSIGQLPQEPQQLFEHHLYLAFSKLDASKPVLLEDESMSIGYNRIPYPLWQQMKKAPILRVIIPFEVRVERLVKDYGSAPPEQLKTSVNNIAQQLGPQHAKECLQLIDEGKLAEVARITLQYYDKAYTYNHTKNEQATIIDLPCESGSVEECAELVQSAMEQYGNR